MSRKFGQNLPKEPPRNGGRPPGRKNNVTLFKEAMQGDWMKILEKEGKGVFIATVQAAKGEPVLDADGQPVLDENGWPMYTGGDSTCKKMILDRLVPVVDTGNADMGKFNININVSGMKPEIDLDADDVEIVDDKD